MRLFKHPLRNKSQALPDARAESLSLRLQALFCRVLRPAGNHAQHVRDDPYDMEKALSILNHVCDFVQQMEKGPSVRVAREHKQLEPITSPFPDHILN